MMLTNLLQTIAPENYHPDAVAKALSRDPQEMANAGEQDLLLIAVSRELKEATIGAHSKTLPNIIVALVDKGSFTASFLAH